MAIYPGKYTTQDTLQPGARGKTFIETLPGYRTEEARVDRTNTHLNVSGHDVPNIKWAMDDRLPVLFRYGCLRVQPDYLSQRPYYGTRPP